MKIFKIRSTITIVRGNAQPREALAEVNPKRTEIRMRFTEEDRSGMIPTEAMNTRPADTNKNSPPWSLSASSGCRFTVR